MKNPNVLTSMIRLSNNSRLTQEAFSILEKKLTDEEGLRIWEWLKWAQSTAETNLQQAKRNSMLGKR